MIREPAQPTTYISIPGTKTPFIIPIAPNGFKPADTIATYLRSQWVNILIQIALFY